MDVRTHGRPRRYAGLRCFTDAPGLLRRHMAPPRNDQGLSSRAFAMRRRGDPDTVGKCFPDVPDCFVGTWRLLGMTKGCHREPAPCEGVAIPTRSESVFRTFRDCFVGHGALAMTKGCHREPSSCEGVAIPTRSES